jgi:hypothetical protein
MLTGQLKLLQRADRGLRRLQLSHSSAPHTTTRTYVR